MADAVLGGKPIGKMDRCRHRQSINKIQEYHILICRISGGQTITDEFIKNSPIKIICASRLSTEIHMKLVNICLSWTPSKFAASDTLRHHDFRHNSAAVANYSRIELFHAFFLLPLSRWAVMLFIPRRQKIASFIVLCVDCRRMLTLPLKLVRLCTWLQGEPPLPPTMTTTSNSCNNNKS